jgi:hypothetical protein
LRYLTEIFGCAVSQFGEIVELGQYFCGLRCAASLEDL